MRRQSTVLPTALVALGLLATAGAAQPTPPAEGVPFNGHSTYAVVAEGGAFDLDAFTLAAWVKLDRTQRSQVMLNRGEPGELFTLYTLDGRVRMLVEYAEGKYTHANTEAPQAGVWTHYTGTYDGEQIKLYVNGRLASTTWL